MAVKLAFNVVQQFSDGTGVPYSGAKLFTYTAGSTTKQTTYTESTGTTPNTDPIVLDSSGRLPQPVWLTTGVSYKFVLAPSTDTDPPGSPIWTLDNVTGINDSSSAQNEWVSGPAPTFVSATSFTLVGDQTTNFHVGRRVKGTVTAGTSYGTITASAFAAATTVTVDTTGSNPIDSGLSAISYGLLSAANFSQSIGLDAVTRQSANIASAATTILNAAGGDYVHITGTTGITAITLAQGHERTVVFDGALTLTNGASLILPGAANITTAAGDTAIFRGEAAGVVRCITFQKAIALNGKQPTRTVLTSGSGTYTTPLGATRINVRMLGGGGGGAAQNTNNGTAGNNSTFSTLTASGGAGGSSGSTANAPGGAGGAASGGDINIPGGQGGAGESLALAGYNSNGGSGAPGPFGGGGMGGNASNGTNAATNSGSGGGGGGGAANIAGGGGGAGGYVEKLFVAPSSTYVYTVGAAANGGAGGGQGGGNGAAGIAIVDEYYN